MSLEPAGSNPEYVLTIVCPDRPGIVFAVSGFLVQHSANILESQQFDDRLEDRFFMRVRFEVYDARQTLEGLRETFDVVARTYSMSWHLWPAEAKYRTLIMASRFGHCLNDLLYRQSTGALQIEVAGHPDRGHHVGDAFGAHDHPRPPVDHGVPDGAGGVVAGITRIQNCHAQSLVVIGTLGKVRFHGPIEDQFQHRRRPARNAEPAANPPRPSMSRSPREFRRPFLPIRRR